MARLQIKSLNSSIISKSENTKSILQENYLADSRPWVVAYSGGKDSTLVLQLVYEMMLELGSKSYKPIYVLSNDTLVESPRIENHLRETLSALTQDMKKRGLKMSCELVVPKAEDTFWAKLIGKGYPPPTRNFRWCTSSMKIKPARRFIERLTSKYGSVVLLLGSRLSESSARRNRMNGRSVNSRGLNPHHEIPNTFVMTPIADWEIEDVWEYLMDGPTRPWGGDHIQLAELYRDATGGECPLILDITTPSCGGSRFGCWTCTVVKQDRSLQGFIDSGDESMIPLIKFCQWIRDVREDDTRRLKFRRNGNPGLGPFDARTRKDLLQRLMQTEQTVGYELISDEVIKYIQSIWSREIDLANSAYTIAKLFGRNIKGEDWTMALREDQKELMRESAKQEGVPVKLLEKLQLLSEAEEFSDLTMYGAKPELRSRIKEIINAATGENE